MEIYLFFPGIGNAGKGRKNKTAGPEASRTGGVERSSRV
ncbi:hypothetical protein KL86DPRO_10155 [uncultured delta proteobacterium]|uniref:Uncharacterized protein n=1 Tax=uncultured delta proteobacterium TaxID=34034 RepID=A0A212IVK6_9DELT|nr:hypothetical protein KL86DPRO_10155 [uncultured delta proteobacterium]